MKHSRAEVHCKTHKIPAIRFEDHTLTSFSGLVAFQGLFSRLGLKERLRGCFSHLICYPIFGHAEIVLLLVVHVLLGYRRLREMRYYSDDPMVQRLLGLKRLPDVATVSRALAEADATSVERIRQLCRELALERLGKLQLRRVTLDFDGSVLSTGRKAEGTAVGFNKKKKGARSYYPLFCTVAQSGQVLDVLHRPGNVHDSRGARDFILEMLRLVRQSLGGVQIEARLDSAFFSDDIVDMLQSEGVEFTLSVPFERFPELKAMVEGRWHWRSFDGEFSFFETFWKPKKWQRRYRLVCVRHRVAQLYKEPLQLDLFVPHQWGFDFQVIVTNKTTQSKNVMAFHHGRGAQEALFAELKSHGQMEYVPVRSLVGNQIYLLATLLAHNLARELQMGAAPPDRSTTETRKPLWIFQQLGTLRRNLIQRAGRFTRPQGELTLTLSANVALKEQFLHYLSPFSPVAESQ